MKGSELLFSFSDQFPFFCLAIFCSLLETRGRVLDVYDAKLCMCICTISSTCPVNHQFSCQVSHAGSIQLT